ncbi:MAG: hypothetical protein HZA46_15580 [Planctomycetales bacterium]|nr:hypothetical protein [Planctomycetales bacterium]
MPYYEFLWTDEIIEHFAEHDLTPEDFEAVVCSPDDVGASDASGLPCAWGETPDGRFIICIYEEIDDLMLLPVTAYEVPRPGESY